MSLDLDKSAWTRFALGDVATASREKVDPADGSVERFVAGEHMDTDDLKIHRWGDVGEVDLGPAFHRRFRPGQVLYGSRRTYLRKVAVANFAGVCANTTFVVETRDENVLLQEFLPFIMSSEPFHAFAIAESKGSVNPYVNWSDIERFEFDLPPLEEQERITGLLWAIEHHRRVTQDLRGAAQRMFRQMLRDYCVPDIQDGLTVGDVVDVLDSKRVPLSATERSGRKGLVPYYGAGGQIDSVDDHLFDEPLILLCEDGFGLAGWDERPIAYRIDGPAWVNNHAHVLRAKSVSTDWLLFTLMHYDLTPYLSTTVKPKLTLGTARGLKVRVTPHEAQFVANIRSSRGAIEAAAAETARLSSLSQALLDDLFGDGR